MRYGWRNRKLQQDYRIVFGTDSGQRVLRDIYQLTQLSQPVDDSGKALTHEGMRHVWAHISAYMHMTPEQMIEFEKRILEDDETDED